MTFEKFKDSLSTSSPPRDVSPLLQALWYDGKNDWEMAHNIAQDVHSKEGSWIHAYLHRKEGDDGNAGYWYARAGVAFPKVTLEEEWKSLVEMFLD